MIGAMRWAATRFASWNAPKSTVASIDVSSGSTSGGTVITLTGTLFTKNGVKRITFGGVDAGDITVIGATTVSCTTPAFDTEGAVDVVVYPVYGGALTLASAFTYSDYVAPTIVSLTPNNGDENGGFVVVLAGTNLRQDGDDGSYVLELGNSASAVWGDMEWVDSETINVTIPKNLGGGTVDVTLTDNHGSSNTLVGGFTFNP